MNTRFFIWMALFICAGLSVWSFVDGNIFKAGLNGLAFLCLVAGLLSPSPSPENRRPAKIENPFEPGSSPVRAVASDEEVLRALQAGNKIEAIKIYRLNHGVGLREAKEAVEALERSPRPFN